MMNEKLGLLTDLIKLARCDSKVREEEYKFLLAMAQLLHVSKVDFDRLFEKNIEVTPPKSEFDRILQFQRLVLLTNIDKETSDVEVDYLKDIGIRMGLNPMATNRVLVEMNKYPNKAIPSEKLIEIFKQHYN